MAGHYRCKTVTSVFISKLFVLINFVKDILNHFCFTYFESFLSNIIFIFIILYTQTEYMFTKYVRTISNAFI